MQKGSSCRLSGFKKDLKVGRHFLVSSSCLYVFGSTNLSKINFSGKGQKRKAEQVEKDVEEENTEKTPPPDEEKPGPSREAEQESDSDSDDSSDDEK